VAAPLLAMVPRLLAVMALAIDLTVLLLDHAVDAGTLLRRDVAVGLGPALSAIDRALALLEAIGLAAGDLPVVDAALDTVLLVVLRPIDVVHRLRVGSPARGDQAAHRQHGVRDEAKFRHSVSSGRVSTDAPS